MTLGLVGRKVGMTRVFDEQGVSVPVTVLDMSANRVTQVKSKDADGYTAVQVTFGQKKANRVNKAEAGHFAKAGVALKKHVKELRPEDGVENYSLAQEIKVDIFEVGEKIDVTGISKGKGFQGSIKRHGQSRGPETHGSHYHRAPGSMGSASDPSKVRKGKKLPGHMGHTRVTIQNLEVARVDAEKNLILIKGAIPGPKKGLVVIKTAVKGQ